MARLALAAALGTSSSLRACTAADDTFDLVVRGGEVIDPSQSLRSRRDIDIRFGHIAALEPDIPAERAQRVIDASESQKTKPARI